MGNSATKEQRPAAARLRSVDTTRALPQNGSAPDSTSPERNASHPVYNVRAGRGSRPDLSTLLGIRGGPPPEIPPLEYRRVSKQEREAKRLEVERITRARDRERSMREEHVDGGYLVTQGVYTGTEDYNKGVVRQLMIERRVAPFWRGLNDHSDSWTENQLVAAVRGRPVPAPDAIPDEISSAAPSGSADAGLSETSINNLTVPIASRSQSFNSDTSSNVSPSQPSFPHGIQPASNSGSTLFRGRAKTLAALTTSSKIPQPEITPREMQLPKDDLVSDQPIEAYLYKDASECPICFLYYPPHLNKTRCCDQAICSECFVQIKRPEPHVPEHADPAAPPPAAGDDVDPEELISEPAACPFCVQPEFGVTYDPPSFRRGLAYVNHPPTHGLANASSAMSSASSLASAISGRLSPAGSGRRRTTSISATSYSVITTDRVRPDWHQKLASARAHTARRSAAATALHTAAYLMGNRQEPDTRPLGAFGRRGILRRTSGPDSASGATSTQLNMLALMSERYAAANAARGEEGEPSMTPGPRGSSRRNRVDDLEDLMMMEAIRLSLASEEDRRKREEKDAKKDSKKKEKANKKAEKAAKKAGIHPSSANQSSTRLSHPIEEGPTSQGGFTPLMGKGKAAQSFNPRSSAVQMPSASEDAQEHLERARANIHPSDTPIPSSNSSFPYRPSHLRTQSNATSSSSSDEGSNPGSSDTGHHEHSSSFDVSPNGSGINVPSSISAQDTYISETPPVSGAGMESMFNFRSLAAMVGDDENSKEAMSDESTANAVDVHGRQRGESSSKVNVRANPEDQGTTTSVSHDRQLQYIDHGLRLHEVDVPDFKITSPSRLNSDLEKANEATKHTALAIEETTHERSQTSS